MKKTKLLIAAFLITSLGLLTFNSNAQYTKLVDFAGATNGASPLGSLMQASDGMLYGMAYGVGATNGYGVLFQYNPATNTYTDKIDFAGPSDENIPAGDLMQATDGMLYGMTVGGGANHMGALFQYNQVTNTLTKKFDFAGTTNGLSPYGSLMQASDGMLYGMTRNGGASNTGVLFQYNPATSTYTKKFDFAGTTNGSQPWGSLMQASDGMLYGMTYGGGANSMGVLFQYNPATNVYTKKLDFAGTTNGANPYGNLMQATDGMLYGVTVVGGATNNGVLFQYNPATSTYTKKLDFAYATGNQPYGSLMQASDGMLYGMTAQGGASSKGVLFQWNPTTSTYADNLDFAGATNGANPQGNLMQATDGMLYGMTTGGGPFNYGTLFKYGGTTGIADNNAGTDFTISPNPSSGIFNLKMNGSENLKMKNLEIYNVVGEKVYQSQINNPQSEIDLSSQPAGIYFLHLQTEQGTSVKKIIISK